MEIIYWRSSPQTRVLFTSSFSICSLAFSYYTEVIMFIWSWNLHPVLCFNGTKIWDVGCFQIMFWRNRMQRLIHCTQPLRVYFLKYFQIIFNHNLNNFFIFRTKIGEKQPRLWQITLILSTRWRTSPSGRSPVREASCLGVASTSAQLPPPSSP